jgi:GNAT superfamily N-acetyltransferase
MTALVPKPPEPVLPALPVTVLPALAALTASLGIPRTVLASDEEIQYAWQDLPLKLREIPVSLRGEIIARMCVAVSTGLFDGAMNYIWNPAILQLRRMVRILDCLSSRVRYALGDASSPKGVDIGAFVSAVKGPRFNANQNGIWVQRLSETHDAQRQMLVGMVQRIYCDPNTSEPARLNALDICGALRTGFTAALLSEERRSGASKVLLQAAEKLAAESGKTRMDLITARTNKAEQAVYESLGWVRDEVFYACSKAVDA